MSRQEVIQKYTDKFASEISNELGNGIDSTWTRITLEAFAAELHEAEAAGVLPMEIYDESKGELTRYHCDSIAGGQHSTRNVPDFLHLAITWPTGVTERFRFTSELVPPAENPWPRFKPHPDDATRCHICGNDEGHHGTSVNHCPPFNLTDGGPEGRDEDTIKRVRRLLRTRVDAMVANPQELTQAEVTMMVGYLVYDAIHYDLRPSVGSQMMSAMASGAGAALGRSMFSGVFGGFGANREKHEDGPPPGPRADPPRRSAKAISKKKPRKRRAR